jgi:hypothetical protein
MATGIAAQDVADGTIPEKSEQVHVEEGVTTPRPAGSRTGVTRIAEAPGRTFHVLDIENCCGEPNPDRTRMVAMFGDYIQVAGVRPGDQGIAAVHRDGLPRLIFDLPSWLRWVMAPNGKDSADNALLGAVDEELVARRYDRIVIGSADHAFAGLARRMVLSGMHVVVAHSAKARISTDLYLSTRDTRCFGSPKVTAPLERPRRTVAHLNRPRAEGCHFATANTPVLV